MSIQSSCVLLQQGTDAFQYRFEDLNHRSAFTVDLVARDPNLIVKLSRLDDWAEQHPDILGPRNAYFYFGPCNTPGRLAYGGGEANSMLLYYRKKKDSSNSRYFTSQNGKECKWKQITPNRLECCDTRSIIAVWEVVNGVNGYNARLTLTQSALNMVTEVLATLTLYHMAKRLGW